MGVIRSKVPWDLRSRGNVDSKRHAKRVREAIKKNLHNIIAEESIISSDGDGKKTKIPVKYLDSYHFKHGKPGDGVGNGKGGKPGDVLKEGKKGKGKSGEGGKPGDAEGEMVYEAEVEIDDLIEMMMEDLELPNLQKKDKVEVTVTHHTYTDKRKKGIMSNWLKKDTILNNMKRNAVEKGSPTIGDFQEDDMRFRTWDEVVERHSNAVVYMMMDRSGSMDEHKRYLCRATFWWLCQFLKTRYDKVEKVFIAHDSTAKVVPEEDFFRVTNSGGTKCSSAYELCWKDIQESRPSSIWNTYVFHFSDGDNWLEDNDRCLDVIKEMAPVCSMMCYGEVMWKNSAWNGDGTLRKSIDGLGLDNVMTALLEEKSDVFPTLAKFLAKNHGKVGRS